MMESHVGSNSEQQKKKRVKKPFTKIGSLKLNPLELNLLPFDEVLYYADLAKKSVDAGGSHLRNELIAGIILAWAWGGVRKIFMSSMLGVSIDTIDRHYKADYEMGLATGFFRANGRLLSLAVKGDKSAIISHYRQFERLADKAPIEEVEDKETDDGSPVIKSRRGRPRKVSEEIVDGLHIIPSVPKI